MPSFRQSSLIAAMALSLGLTAPATAEEADTASIKALFAKQSLNLGKPRSLLGGGPEILGSGRGLVIAPAQDATQAPATVSEATEVAETSYVTYNQLPEDMQLNIRIKFDFDSAALRADEKPRLASLCEAIRGVDIETFQIVGHTDAKGSASYNEHLSLLRAEEVKRHLVTDCGIDAARLQAVGVGEAFPADVGDPNADQNRRVEFQALS